MSDVEKQVLSVLEALLIRNRKRLTSARDDEDIRMLLDLLHDFRKPDQTGAQVEGPVQPIGSYGGLAN